ncbi:MAG: hypothetical protein AAB354_10770 [candidate division KSB1 bacterium]
MAKANLVLPDGTTVNIEGTAEEVATLLSRFSKPEAGGHSGVSTQRKRKKSKYSFGSNKSKKTDGPTSLVEELAAEGYFKSKRTLGDIQKRLEERGHIYAQTSISPVLTRLTRKRTIRRIKEKKGWVYVN